MGAAMAPATKAPINCQKTRAVSGVPRRERPVIIIRAKHIVPMMAAVVATGEDGAGRTERR